MISRLVGKIKDVSTGGVEGVTPPNIFKVARELATVFCDLFVFLSLTIVGQLVKTPPPPIEAVSAHHWVK